MVVTITVAGLQAALRLGDTPEETAETTRLLNYATEAVTRQAPNAPTVAQNEAVRRISGYLFDQPEAGRGDGYANAMRNSGAARILLPYRVHRLGYADDTPDDDEEPTLTTQRFEQQAPYTATPTPTDIGAAYPVGRYRVQVRQSNTLTPEAGSILYAGGVAAPSNDNSYFRIMPNEFFEFTGGSPTWVRAPVDDVVLAVARYAD